MFFFAHETFRHSLALESRRRSAQIAACNILDKFGFVGAVDDGKDKRGILFMLRVATCWLQIEEYNEKEEEEEEEGIFSWTPTKMLRYFA